MVSVVRETWYVGRALTGNKPHLKGQGSMLLAGNPDKQISLFLASSNNAEIHKDGQAPIKIKGKLNVILQR